MAKPDEKPASDKADIKQPTPADTGKGDTSAKPAAAPQPVPPGADPVALEEQRDEDRAERDRRQENNTNNAGTDQSNITRNTKDVVAGDLNAGEGNVHSGAATHDENLTAGVRATTKGPDQPHLEAEDIDRIDDEKTGAELGIVEGQDPEAVADRLAEETEGLMASQGERVLRTGSGEVAFAEHGTQSAANIGLQSDASGHFESATHVKSPRSGTRV